MRRRGFLSALGGAAVGWPITASGQEKPMPLIGWLGFATARAGPASDGFHQGLRELGYVEGQNIAIEYRFPAGNSVNFSDPIEELIRLKVKVVVPAGFPATVAVHKSTLAIPAVFVVADPVGSGFARSLARPGGNMTGLSLAVEEQFSGKWLELLKQVFPRVSRVAYLWNPTNHSSASSWTMMHRLAPRFELTLQSVEVKEPKDMGSAFEAIVRDRAEAIIVDSDASTALSQPHIVEFAVAHRLPQICAFRSFVDAGGLMSYGPSLHDLWRRAAAYVDKILKGAKPADLPIEEPTKFDLVVNLQAAKALGLAMPQSLLARADEVIE
jgi:putative ABC transport system substrate-binding protein